MLSIFDETLLHHETMKLLAGFFSFILFSFFSGKETKPTFEKYYQKGVEEVRQYNYPAAIYYLDSAALLQPDRDSVYSLIAHSYRFLGKPQNAIEYCNKCLLLNPRNANAYFTRGTCIAQINLFNDTIFTDSITKLIKKHKGNEKWLTKNIWSRYYIPAQTSGMYDYGKAIEDITKTIQLDSSQAYYYSYRAYYFYWLNQPEKAKPDYDRAIELEPNNANHYLNRGIFNEKYSSPGNARDDYSKGIRLDSNYAELYERRGRLYRDVFYDKEYACKDFRKATLLGRFIEDMDDYCKPNQIDSLLHGQYSYPAWRHDFNNCYCPNPKDMFNPETDTIKEIELVPGHKQKMIDIKDSEKTTWEFEDGRVIEISKKTKERWLKEEEERKKKTPTL